MPLFSEERAFGSLIVGSKKPNAYKDRELKLLKYATTQLTAPLKNFYLSEENQRQREGLDWFKSIFHYTKTPLTPIVSSSELLTEEIQGQPGSPLLPLAQNIQGATQKLRQNLDLFEKIAQIVLPQTQLDLNTFSPEETLKEAANYAYAAAARNSRSLILELPPDLPQISADPQKLEQVLHILLDNAVGRTPEGGKIELRARARKGELMVEVIDRGPAFSTEEKKGLLEHYRPSEVDRLPFPELSLSLAICRRIIELHGGKLCLESKPGRETTFAFSLPIASRAQVLPSAMAA